MSRDHERRLLSTSYQELSGAVDTSGDKIDYTKLSPETIEDILANSNLNLDELTKGKG